jgi:electron transport complex protein RnfB
MGANRIDAIDALLPQTQCTRCGYPDCRAYASAISSGEASYDQCAPGGQVGLRHLANFLGEPEIPLNPAYGSEGPRTAAVIDERRCIGCTLCIQACPVDAIMGRAKRMHTVLTAYCTGCDLCLPPCPVDCIDMVELSDLSTLGHDAATRSLDQSTDDLAHVSRRRYQIHKERYERERDRTAQRLNAKSGTLLIEETGSAKQARSSDPDMTSQSARESGSGGSDRKKAIIEAALLRARARKSAFERARRKTR